MSDANQTRGPSLQTQGSGSSSRFSLRSPREAIQPVAAPAPPPPIKLRKHPFITIASNLFTVLLVAVAVASAAAYSATRGLSEPGPLAADRVMVVQGGMWDIADQLEREGVVSSQYLFIVGAMTAGQSGGLKKGEYVFKQGATLQDIVRTLTEGKSILHAVTLPEGLTSEQVIARLAENEVLTGEVRETPREGAILPDTYKFERGMSRERLLATMQAQQKKIVGEIWAKRASDLPIRTPQELVTLASIVEKETGRADERSRVASVFVNRLNKRMKLQSDPTIVYGLVGGKGTLGRQIMKSEIERATPYNTYAIEGLPPGPIANPGRAALEAVANPSRTRDLFFVADGTGGHVFAETYEQHLRNVQNWRRIEKARAPGDQPQRPVDRAEQAEEALVSQSRGVPAAPAVTGDAPPSAFAAPGVTGRAGTLPGAPGDARRGADAARAGATPPVQAVDPRTGRPRADEQSLQGRNRVALDAVEGTSRDPLRNRTFDLNSTKTIPNL